MWRGGGFFFNFSKNSDNVDFFQTISVYNLNLSTKRRMGNLTCIRDYHLFRNIITNKVTIHNYYSMIIKDLLSI